MRVGDHSAGGSEPVHAGEAKGGHSTMQFTDTASAGNGGVATAASSGGAVQIGDVNSGGNAGNAVGIGDTSWGSVAADGGDVANSTQLSISANGGTAIADASGGDYNLLCQLANRLRSARALLNATYIDPASCGVCVLGARIS